MPNRHIKVFVSYAWTSEEYQQRVIDFSTQLRRDGIDVVLDVWDLKPGEDKYKFMESSVTNPEIERVLILCNGEYKRKADSREGGVGSETMIISPRVMNLTDPGKFLPIVFEKSTSEEAVVPAYLEHMIYIDLHNKETFHAEYKKLVLQIHNLPTYSKPKLGNSPSYVVTETSSNLSDLTVIIDEMNGSLNNHCINFQELLYNFSIQFIETLNSFKITGTKTPEKCYDEKINELLDVRNLFLEALSLALRRIDADPVGFSTGLFERMANEVIPDSKAFPYEHFSFLIWESVICTASLLFKRERFDDLSRFLLFTYKMHFPGSWKMHPLRVSEFSYRLDQYELYMGETSPRKLYSFAAEKLVKQRFWKNEISSSDLIIADYILFQLTYYLNNYGHAWRPFLFVYGGNAEDDDSLLNCIWKKLISRSYCSKVLHLFGVGNVEELKVKLSKFDIDSYRIYENYWREPLTPVYPMKYLDAIASAP